MCKTVGAKVSQLAHLFQARSKEELNTSASPPPPLPVSPLPAPIAARKAPSTDKEPHEVHFHLKLIKPG